jgi:hypothetical protein
LGGVKATLFNQNKIMSSWIKLRRNLKDWQWYSDHNATRLLIHLLISVNYEDKKWRGILIKSGSMVLSWKTLSEDVCLSVRQCRTAMEKLISSNEVTRKVTNKYQVISLVKWEEIQLNKTDVTNKASVERQTDDKQMTTTKEYKEIKEEKKLVFFSWIDYRKEIKKEIKSEETIKRLIDRFNAEPLEKCKWVVENSIENNYQGLFWDNYKTKQNKPLFKKQTF